MIGTLMSLAAALADAPATALDGLPVMRAQVAGGAYLRFLVGELKPMIDARYRTLPGRRDTFAMGSSMGGLIAAYAAARYPTLFGGFAGLSTAWQIGDGFTQRWYAAHLPPRSTRVYFDYGTGTNDAVIGPWQDRLTAAATVAGRHWLVRSWPGDAHTESAWAGRVGMPIQWLLGPPLDASGDGAGERVGHAIGRTGTAVATAMAAKTKAPTSEQTMRVAAKRLVMVLVPFVGAG